MELDDVEAVAVLTLFINSIKKQKRGKATIGAIGCIQ